MAADKQDSREISESLAYMQGEAETMWYVCGRTKESKQRKQLP